MTVAKNEVKNGIILSYALIVLNAVYTLIVTPFIMDVIGEAEFGVYKTIASLSSALMVLDLGLGGTTMRYIAKYHTDGDNNKIKTFVSMALGEAIVLISIVGIASTTLYFNIHTVFQAGLNSVEIELAKKLFLLLAFNIGLHIIENVFNGIITGFNKFTFGNSLKLFRIIVRIVATLLFLNLFKSALVLAMIDLALTIGLILFEGAYIILKLKVKPILTLRNWDFTVFKESMIYTMFLFLTSIAAQINNNLDNVVIGAISGASFVAVYSFGLVIFSMFEQLSTAVSGVMLPTVTRILKKDADGSKIQNAVIKAGRLQFALLGAAVVGFSILGQDFVALWLGDGFEDVYIIALTLMFPALFELCVNVCLSVLRAKNLLGFRTLILTATTILNFIITVIGVRLFGYIAAAVGTATGFVIGSLIIMNLYYYKKLGFNMLRIYQKIVDRTWICLLLGGLAIYISSRYLYGTWFAFIINVILFALVYGISMFLFGFSKEEKKQIPILNKFLKGEKNG